MKKIGYARVSSPEQNLNRQIAALRAEGGSSCDRIFIDVTVVVDVPSKEKWALRREARVGFRARFFDGREKLSRHR